MSAERAKEKTEEIVISSSDILFECPSCGKSLVVDEGAEGLIIICPQCQTSVIVPPKQDEPTLAPPPQTTRAHPAKEERTGAARAQGADLAPHKRLAILAGQLKEMQTQRTEISSRIASRLNEVNRDLVLLARLETSQQQILSEWNQLVEKIAGGQSAPATDSDSTTPVVVGSSVSAAGHTRVSFRQ